MSETLSSEGERAKTLSSEENDLLQRSNKKFKSHIDEINPDVDMTTTQINVTGNRKSYSQMTQSFGRMVNPLFDAGAKGDEDCTDEESEPDLEEEDEDCPHITLTKEDKMRIRSPWRNAIIIKLFDKRMGYEVLMRRLR